MKTLIDKYVAETMSMENKYVPETKNNYFYIQYYMCVCMYILGCMYSVCIYVQYIVCIKQGTVQRKVTWYYIFVVIQNCAEQTVCGQNSTGQNSTL